MPEPGTPPVDLPADLPVDFDVDRCDPDWAVLTDLNATVGQRGFAAATRTGTPRTGRHPFRLGRRCP
jgi:hypothetical protein